MEEVLDFFKNIIKPYKYTSIEDVNNADIKNQIEKYSKMSIIASNNMFMNLIMINIELFKEGITFVKSKYDEHMGLSINGIQITENISDTKLDNINDETKELETSINDEDNNELQEQFESIEKPLTLKKEE